MKTVIILLMVLFTATIYAQQEQPPCNKGEIAGIVMQFKSDLKNNKVKLYTLSGLRPLATENRKAFMDNYNISFHDFGCVAPVKLSNYNIYNKQVFTYLKSEFGTEWQKYMPHGVIGWHEWKETN